MQIYDTPLDVKVLLQERDGIPIYEQRLIHAGTELKDNVHLSNYNISNGSTLFLVIKSRDIEYGDITHFYQSYY